MSLRPLRRIALPVACTSVALFAACLGNEGQVSQPTTPVATNPTAPAPDTTSPDTAPETSVATTVVTAPDAVETSTSPAETSPTDVPASEVSTNPLIVHEWGTFTSVQSSSGVSFAGLHHEDEALPYWVYRRNLTDPFNYFFEQLPEEPIQQLETPVVYFYSEKPQDVRFRVDFPEGVIGQWFPRESSYLPKHGEITAMTNGMMEWNVTVDPGILPSQFKPVDPNEIWAPSRQVASTPIRSKLEGFEEEFEQFIFYRGLGRFDLPVRVTTSSEDVMHIRNPSEDALPAVFLIHVTPAGEGAVVSLGALPEDGVLTAAVPRKFLPAEAYVAEAKTLLKAAIVASGMYDDEAQAMVDTWTRSWFKNVGLRVLYIVPAPWTERLLPLDIAPAPASIVRTLVGRIETMTPTQEAEAFTLIASLEETSDLGAAMESVIAKLGRFAEPRIRLMIDAHGTTATRDQLLESAHNRR